jgi:hypothetical protein
LFSIPRETAIKTVHQPPITMTRIITPAINALLTAKPASGPTTITVSAVLQTWSFTTGHALPIAHQASSAKDLFVKPAILSAVRLARIRLRIAPVVTLDISWILRLIDALSTVLLISTKTPLEFVNHVPHPAHHVMGHLKTSVPLVQVEKLWIISGTV